MHAGFAAVRNHVPMNLRRLDLAGKGHGTGVAEDIARACEIRRDCRRRRGAGGDSLLGAFGTADAMFAPVVARLDTCVAELDDACSACARRTERAGLRRMA